MELLPSDFDAFGVDKPADRKRLNDLIEERRRVAQLPRRPSPPRVRKVTEASIERERELRERRLQRERARAEAASGGGTSMRQLARVSVCVRKRPLSRKELSKGDKDIIQAESESQLSVYELKEKVDLTKYLETHSFVFDRVFSDDQNNEEVYEHTAKPLVEALFQGGRSTCFAYGQTGAGKTFTMAGDGYENPGLYSLAIRDLFDRIAARTEEDEDNENLEVWISFFEIYGSRLHDLLGNRAKLECREDGNNEVRIVGLTERRCSNEEDVMDAIDEANSYRSTGVTGANDDSSRSHAVFQIELKDNSANPQLSDGALKAKSILPGRNAADTGRGVEIGRLCFIDLAGSERGSDTANNDKQTRLEGAEINKSLLALKECIRAMGQRKDHTPFRGSKLTQVLKASFVGKNCRTVMIANVSPATSNVEHTLNTLRYSDRVKEIRKDKVGHNPNATFTANASSRGSKSKNLRVRRATLASGIGRESQSEANLGSYLRNPPSGDDDGDRRQSDQLRTSKLPKAPIITRPTRRVTRSATRASQINETVPGSPPQKSATAPVPVSGPAPLRSSARLRTTQSAAQLPPRRSFIPRPPRTVRKTSSDSDGNASSDGGGVEDTSPKESNATDITAKPPTQRIRIPRRSTVVALPRPDTRARARDNTSAADDAAEEPVQRQIPRSRPPAKERPPAPPTAAAPAPVPAERTLPSNDRPRSAGWLPDTTVNYFSGADDEEGADLLFSSSAAPAAAASPATASDGSDSPAGAGAVPSTSTVTAVTMSETSRAARDEPHSTGLRDVIRHHHMQIEELMRLCEMDVQLVKAAEEGRMDPAEYALKLDMNLSQKLDMVIGLKAKVGWLTSDKP